MKALLSLVFFAGLASQAAACPVPVALTHKVTAKLSRKPVYYTQGLVYHNGALYESTGLYGKSGLYKIDPASGAYLKLSANPNQYFGEGLAKFGRQLFQLTWKEGTVFVYDLEAKGVVPSPSMTYAREGWGLTTNGSHLIASDGGSKLHYLNPADLATARSLPVLMGRDPVANLNELEHAKGKIFANVFMTDIILRIDPATGCVDGSLDLSGLLSKAERDALQHGEVLNGIAYDPAEDAFFVTGKNWPAIYKLKIGN